VADERPDSPEAARKLELWDNRARPFIILAALIPIIATVAERREVVLIVIDFVAWLVFLVDLIVHVRLTKHYLRRGIGIFDLGVVIATFPWYIIPGAENADLLLIARVARVVRLFIAGARLGPLGHLFQRLGRAFLYATLLLVVCSIVVQQVEDNRHGFDNLGDSLWWGVVTITTVGYGDIVPETTAGRIVAVVLMIGGLALLGALAGSLAAFLRVQDVGRKQDDANGMPDAVPTDVARELAALRAEVAELNRRVAALQSQEDSRGP